MAVTFSKEEQAALDAAGAAWNAANAKGDKAGMDAAHAAAEAIRAGKGYSGGSDGSQYIPTSNPSQDIKGSSGNSQYTGYTPTGAGDQNWRDFVGMTAADRAEMDKWGAAYNSATSQSQKDYAHAQAEAIREKYGYMGGDDGSEYIPISKQQTGNFTYDAAPTYTDRYSDRIDEMLNQILNRDKFSYDATTDPLYAQYRDQYHREGQLAMEDTLGQIAARTGGMASSYAQTAAQQVYQGYAQQLADKIPELYQLAYEMYLDDIDLQVQDLGLLQGVSDTAYNRFRDTMADWRDDRDFAYGVYRDDIADNQWQTSFDRDVFESDRDYNYGLERDKIEDARYDEEWAHQVAQDALAQRNWEKTFAEEQRQFNADYSLDASKFNYQKQQDAGDNNPSGGDDTPDNPGGGYDNGSLTKSQVKALQKALGVEQDGYYGPATKNEAKGLSADAAYKKYVGSVYSGTNKDGTGAGDQMWDRGSQTDPHYVMQSLGLAGVDDKAINELFTYGGLIETSTGSVKWASGWNANNWRKKLTDEKIGGDFGVPLLPWLKNY